MGDPAASGSNASARLFGSAWPWWLPPLLILLVGVGLYLNSFSGAFVFDDQHDIVANRDVHRLSTAVRPTLGSWRPVVYVTFALNYAVGGEAVWGYHLVNLVIHLLAALTLYDLVRRTLLLEPQRTRFEAAAPGLALAAALLWLAHPLQTESVTYVVQRYESLMGLFYLLTVYAVLRGATSAARSGAWYLAAGVCCGLGMLSKEVMVTAPLVVLLFDRVFLSRSWAEVGRRWPLHAGLAATWGLLLWPVWAAFGGSESWAGLKFKGHTPLEYARSQPGVILHYLRLAFWPDGLCLDYRWPVARTTQEIVAPALGLGALVFLSLALLWLRPRLGYLGVCFFLILAPTSSVMPVADLAFEHRTYLSLAALAVLVVLGGWAAVNGLGRLAGVGPSGLAGAAAALVTVLVAAEGWATVRRNRDYASEEVMWRDIVAKRPLNERAHNNLAAVVLKAGQTDEAVEHLRTALRLQERARGHGQPYTLTLLGKAHASRREFDEALRYYRAALLIDPEHVTANCEVGALLMKRGDRREVFDLFSRALRKDPTSAVAHNHLGALLWLGGRLPEAREHYREALRLDPAYACPHDNLGILLWQEGKPDEALAHFYEALRLDPQLAEAHNHLGAALATRGELDAALRHFDQALAGDPDLPEAHHHRGLVLARRGRDEEAAASFRAAVRLRPNSVPFRQSLASVLRRLGQQDAARAECREIQRLDPGWSAALLRTAWQLATHPEPGRRDGPRAVELARLAGLADGETGVQLDTLAAAYAEAGRFSEAVASAERALEATVKAPELVRGRLTLYRQRQAFRDTNLVSGAVEKK